MSTETNIYDQLRTTLAKAIEVAESDYESTQEAYDELHLPDENGVREHRDLMTLGRCRAWECKEQLEQMETLHAFLRYARTTIDRVPTAPILKDQA